MLDHIGAECGLNIIVTALEEDVDYLRSILAKMEHPVARIKLFSFDELAVAVKNARLVITVNTATMHLAISQDCPTVAIIGGTPKQVVFPEGNPRFRCVEDPGLGFGIYHPRISEITVEEVMEQIREVMKCQQA